MHGDEQGAQDWAVEFGLASEFDSLPLACHSFCLWEPQAGGGDESKTEYWRAMEPPLGYGHTAEAQPTGSGPAPLSDACSPRTVPLTQRPSVVVIDDAGIGFRDRAHRSLWSFGKGGSKAHCPDWVVLKLTGSIEKSALWDEIVRQCRDNLVVIVPAEELRRRDVRLSRGLSWEATAEDLAAELHNNPKLAPMLKARHLIVTFQSDGAFWFDNDSEGAKSLLVFDATRAEGEWSEGQGKGGAFGYLSCFTAAVVRELCLWVAQTEPGKNKPDIEAALGAGLGASRELRQIGHGEVVLGKDEPKPGFPFARIVAKIRQPVEKFVSALIPHNGRMRGRWMMLDEWQVQASSKAGPRPHSDAAMAVAVLGPEALERFPVARFGNYQTVDRNEIESLRTIRQLIRNYTKVERQKTPLNLGVFGPPGSGKSFIVIEIAKAAGIKEEDVLVFNLSQFGTVTDLYGAFHQVRDKILKGSTPLVLWDEFDSREYMWLQYLLAPMEDGEFQDGQITHPIGKCIFVFAGATSATYDKFGPCNATLLSSDAVKALGESQGQEMERLWRAFVLAKGPDFKSRLVSYLNLLGMNRRQVCEEENGRRRWKDDRSDLCYPIRRAFFIRAVFKCKGGDRLNVDEGVLRALLEIPRYQSAGRSVQVLCQSLRDNSAGRPSRSGLPGYELLNMHVDAREFWEIAERHRPYWAMAQELAPAMHEAYRLRIRGNEKKKHQDVEFAKLDVEFQAANLGQAARIPEILRMVGLELVRGPRVLVKKLVASRTKSDLKLARLLRANTEVLAEAEHNGWMVERMLRGWRYARIRDDAEKRHDCLVPYSQLPDTIKGYDRLTIVGAPPPARKPHLEQFGYVDIVKTAGFRVVRSAVKPPDQAG